MNKKHYFMMVLLFCASLCIAQNKESIFSKLFSDINSFEYYENNSDFITDKVNSSPPSPEIYYIVKNDDIYIMYWPGFFTPGVLTPFAVEINNKNNIFYLGAYFGENINIINNLFLEEPSIFTGENYEIYRYENHEKAMWIMFKVENKIITGIQYGRFL